MFFLFQYMVGLQNGVVLDLVLYLVEQDIKHDTDIAQHLLLNMEETHVKATQLKLKNVIQS